MYSNFYTWTLYCSIPLIASIINLILKKRKENGTENRPNNEN